MTTPKLPVWQTVGETYRSLRERAAAAGVISRVWVGVAVAAFALSGALLALAPPSEPGFAGAVEESAGERVAALSSLSVLVMLIGTFVILVRWHRLIIHNAAPADTRKGAFGAGMLYLARSSLLGGMAVAVIVVGGLLPTTLSRSLPISTETRWYVTATSVAVAIICALILVARWSMILPATAVGDSSVNLSRSWRLTRGNSWRLLAGSLLTAGPVFAIDLILNGYLRSLPHLAGDVLQLAILLAVSLVLFVATAVIQASFLSYAYLHFKRE